MDLLRFWREAGWQEVVPDVYSDAYERFGGSVLTHPVMVEAVSSMTQMPLRYVARYDGDDLIAALPLWGKFIAGSKKPLKKARKNRIVDTGNAEVILPLKADHSFDIRFSGSFLSSLHTDSITSLKPLADTCISLARSHQPGQENGLSKKFKYNQRRELRLFEEAGGYYRPATELDSQTFSKIYTSLFFQRWGFHIKGHEHFQTFLKKVRPLQTGFMLFSKEDEPVAVQWVLKAESPEWLSFEYINGGVAPEFSEFSPGSILSYLNTRAAEEESMQKNKQLRFSFGRSDREYKDRWCTRVPVYRT